MLTKREIRIIILHEWKLGVNASEASRKINKAWGEGTAPERTVRRWYQAFRSGDFTLDDKDGRGRPVLLDNTNLRAVVDAMPSASVREISTEVNASKSSVANHLKQLGKVKKLDQWIPHQLTDNQRQQRFDICSALLTRNNQTPFIDSIITCDEKWIMYDNLSRASRWLDKDEPPKKFPKQKLTKQKVLVTVWWSSRGLIYYRFLPAGQTINADLYCQYLQEMHQELLLKQPALANRKQPIILHDNARPHTARKTLQIIQDLGYEILAHPPYSPDLSPTDYHFFRHLNNALHGKQLTNREEAIKEFQTFIDSKDEEFYSRGMNKLKERWEACVDAQGSYFD